MSTEFLKHFLRRICACIGVLCLLFSGIPVNAEGETDDLYHVVDFASGDTEIGSYSTYKQAYAFYKSSVDNYDNLGITQNGSVMIAEYGIALLNGSSACDVNIEFTYDSDGTDGYVNSCYGIDAAYLTTDSNGEKAEIRISNATGWTDLSNIQIIPLQKISNRLSAFVVQNGTLYHQIKTEMNDDNYASIIKLGKAPDYLTENIYYYSYDGHYFYAEDTLWQMLNDYRLGNNDNAINTGNPYYNYYQFVSHRSITNATLEQANSYLADHMDILGALQSYEDDEKDSVNDTMTRSQYFGNMNAFWQYQYEYGANALMMLAMSANESAYGRSSLSFTRNNLFGHAAYDNDTEASASRYSTISNSIYSHAKYYISGSYCSPLKSQFHGGFFGNKASGMNVSYASDPYWGEKAASYYLRLDEAIGSGDGGSYTLGIKTSNSSISVYRYADTKSSVFYDVKGTDQAFIILSSFTSEDGTAWYGVQCDATIDDAGTVALEYKYDYANDIAYVKASDIQIILTGTKSNPATFAQVTFNADGGTFPGGETDVSYMVPTDNVPVASVPTKEGYLFNRWDTEPAAGTTEARTYTAIYDAVSSIEVSSIPKQQYELNDRVDLTDGIITVHFENGSSKKVDMTTSMISGYNLGTSGSQEITVKYAGCSTTYSIEVSEEKDTLRAQILAEILRINEAYADKANLTVDDIADILAVKKTIDENLLPDLTQNQLRTLDHIMRTAINDRIRYVINRNSYDLQVSGLTVSMPLGDSLGKLKYLEDTYRISMKQGVTKKAEEAMSKIASALQNTEADSFTINAQKNFTTIKYKYPFIMTIQKPEGSSASQVFTILHYNSDTGDVEKCYTRQSQGTISFLTKGNGAYMLTSISTSNTYLDADPVESLTANSQSIDMERYRIYLNIALSIAFILGWILYRKTRKKRRIRVREKRIRETEKRMKEPLPPADVTQALQIFETQAVRLTELEDTQMIHIDPRDLKDD